MVIEVGIGNYLADPVLESVSLNFWLGVVSAGVAEIIPICYLGMSGSRFDGMGQGDVCLNNEVITTQ